MSTKLNIQENLKVVLDSSTYVAALLSKSGVCAKIFELIIEQKILNYYTKEIIDELFSVLSRPKFELEKTKIDHFLDLIIESSFLIPQSEDYKIRLCRDPSDDKFLSLAKQIGANYIITLDQDLLILDNIEKTKIIKPEEFIIIRF